MLNDALLAIIALLKMDARDSSVTLIRSRFFCSQETYNLQNLAYSSLSLSIFFVATKTKTELALVIAFGTPVMAYGRSV